MSFKDIACHVFAIDGYSDDKTAEAVNSAYENCANNLTTSNNQASRQLALQTLVTHCRKSKVTGESCKIYGGFRRGQKAPEHMWIEYDDKIYDTMPGQEMETVDATTANRQCPGSENKTFGDGAVCIDDFLTENQLSNIS